LSATVRLLATGSCVPERVLSNADLERGLETTDDGIVSQTGIRERRILAEGQKNSDIAVEAGRRALAAAGLEAGDLDHLVFCSCTGDRPLPSTACKVQHRLGASCASAVDLSAAGSGFVAGLSHGAGLIGSGQMKHVLVVASEALTRFTDYQDRDTCMLFGDGAGAAVLGAGEGGHRIGDFHLGTDGSGAPHLTVPAGGSELRPSAETVAGRLHYVHMDGSEVFKFAVAKMIELIAGASERLGCRPGDIDLVVPQQVNRRIIQAAIDRLDMRPEQFFCNLEKYGDTSAASSAIALDEAARGGRIGEGDRLLLVVFGAGFAWGSATVSW